MFPFSKMAYWLVVSTLLISQWEGLFDYSQYMESHKIHVPNHQPDKYPLVI